MDRKKTFNENYNKYRPSYTKELFKDIIEYAAISKQKNLIEVGIGTRIFTRKFLDTSCNLKAIELGRSLAEFSKHISSMHCSKDYTLEENDEELALLVEKNRSNGKISWPENRYVWQAEKREVYV